MNLVVDHSRHQVATVCVDDFYAVIYCNLRVDLFDSLAVHEHVDLANLSFIDKARVTDEQFIQFILPRSLAAVCEGSIVIAMRDWRINRVSVLTEVPGLPALAEALLGGEYNAGDQINVTHKEDAENLYFKSEPLPKDEQGDDDGDGGDGGEPSTDDKPTPKAARASK